MTAESHYKVAQAYAVLGDKAAALRVLRKLVEGGFFRSPYFMKAIGSAKSPPSPT